MAITPVSKLAAIGFVWDIFFLIAFPTVLFALLGRRYDRLWGTSPWLTIIGFIFAIAISGALVYRKAKRFANDMRSDEPHAIPSRPRVGTPDSRLPTPESRP